jgi:hypothetical protein
MMGLFKNSLTQISVMGYFVGARSSFQLDIVQSLNTSTINTTAETV